VDPFAEEVAKIVEDLVSLPGSEIRGVYLAQAMEGADAELAIRVRVAAEVLAILEPTSPTSSRLEALLRGALAPDLAVRDAAVAAAKTGAVPPLVPESGTVSTAMADVQADAVGPLADLTVGVGDIAWGTSALRLKARLGDDAEVSFAGGWSGPTYPQDLAVVTMDRNLLGCTGEEAFILTSQGLSRVWFTSEGAECWAALSEAVQAALGPAAAEKTFTPAGAMLAREWEAPAEVTLAVALEDGEPRGDVFLHLQPPDGVIEDGVRYTTGPEPRSSSRRRDAAAEESREARGLRLKSRAGAQLGTGFALMAVAVGAGAGSIAGFFEGPEDSSEAFAALAVTGIGLGTASGILLTVGGAMDVHANILLAAACGTGGCAPVEVRLALGLGGAGVTVRF
jgi:hypothetical protein